MSDNVIILPVIRRMNTPAVTPLIEQNTTIRRRYTVEMNQSPEFFKRLEKIAWDRRCTPAQVIAQFVSERMEGEETK
jgi:hypothetical protein